MAKLAKKRELALQALADLMRVDSDVRMMVVATVRKQGVADPTELATRFPKEFDALHVAALDLVEQAPLGEQWIPGMSR